MEGPFSRPPAEEERGRWIPLAIATVVIVAVVAIVFVLSRNAPRQSGPAPEDPYASNLQISDLKLSQAQNFVGASVTYVEGKVANTGSKTVTAATVEVVFRNSMGQVVGREAQPLMLLQQRPGYADVTPLSKHPLVPNENDNFRLTFEHISADWNQGLPELRFTKISTQ